MLKKCYAFGISQPFICNYFHLVLALQQNPVPFYLSIIAQAFKFIKGVVIDLICELETFIVIIRPILSY